MTTSERFFTDDDFYTGAELTGELVAAAEASLGVRLPSAYVHLLRDRNGGEPVRSCLRTTFETSWAADHFEISAVLGVGAPRGIDAPDGRGSTALVAEWGYPDIGVVVCDTPAAGPDTVMLDYSACGPSGEPTVAYVDEDRVPRTVAANFADFIRDLEPASAFGD